MSSTSQQLKTLNVTWDDHLQNLSGLFQELYDNKKLVDVTLYCTGGSLKAHKIVLSACSPYFAKIFQEIEMKHPIVILKGISFEEMHQLLEFMYKGSINILEQDLSALIQAGSYLEIKGMDAKNIPSNLRNNLKRPSEIVTNDFNEEQAKKIKEINKINDDKSRDSSPSTNTFQTDSSRRETRFKGQKRVDVRFTTGRLISSVTTVTKKKENETQEDKTGKNKINTKKSIDKDKETAINNEIKGKKSITVKQEKNEEEQTADDKLDNSDGQENLEQDSISKLVITDVYSTRDEPKSSTSHEILKENESSSESEIEDEGEEENVTMPDFEVAFKEIDSEINIEEGIEQNSEEHLTISHLECSYCHMHFKTDNDLFCHQKVHTDTRPYKCDFCESYFHRSSHLARHRRKHIGDRPYECKSCGKSFSRSDKLKTHCRQVHDEDYQPPHYIKKKYDFVEYTGEVKRPRGRPRKYPGSMTRLSSTSGDENPKEKRPRGRPKLKSTLSTGDAMDNYDITNLPFGDFTYLTSSIPLENPYQDISIIPVTQTTSNEVPTVTPAPDDSNNCKNDESQTNQSVLLSSIRQIGECTIQPVAK